jgi:cytidylate kinase
VIVAIDGPAGAGKSTVARMLAERLGFRYLDTGAMYRALTWLALERSIPLGDEPALRGLASDSPVSFVDSHVEIAGIDVTAAIRASRIDAAVSAVAQHESVRSVMRARQRALAAETDAVLEGRDIGTVVCPDADVKVYLVAHPDERARRRQSERTDVGEDTLADLLLRDQRDAAQMRRAPDAVEIDTTILTAEEVVSIIAGIVAKRAEG